MSTVAGLRSPLQRDEVRADPHDFSVVLGGPLYQMVRRAHLAGGALELLHRRIIVITLFAWLPLLILSVLDGRAWGDAVQWECESLEELPYWMPAVRPDCVFIRGADLALPTVERRVWP